MKLSLALLAIKPLVISSIPVQNGPMLDHKPGEGSVLGNMYMHTLGHAVDDVPLYVQGLAQGDILGTVGKLVKFALYHNPVNLAKDFGGGQLLGGGGNSGGHQGH
ncbi:hypothetical protein CONCODRAFT_70133 [Conidiobolus coronatus NRRL 28638]|uniref:Secreted protein n=1 Tax=Conidiobolus coronatus (strain ATCC 28846 / CBS 209.66 / NRRL 28638) TaxID=796925 RepID=A0A137P7S5_CONC2|nr:hypothetical protein CONCODRAFT_70133 [Conidiobolus coronatus NRRL 28638]|eukprot:KXN71067.1 hypothetical protein CONCODRAFT_70133 [Conidiobolus coronatus NRRL 28638]